MKRLLKLSEAAQAELLRLHKSPLKPQSLIPFTFVSGRSPNYRFFSDNCAQIPPSQPPSNFHRIVELFSNRLAPPAPTKPGEELIEPVLFLAQELAENFENSAKVIEVLNAKGLPLFRKYSDGSAFVELLNQLDSWHQLALEVLFWRRKQAEFDFPMTSEEYAKGIKIAGRLLNTDLASELFIDAMNNGVKSTGTYNALMSAYMYNSLPNKCLALFQDLKEEEHIHPSVVTYNILISIFGRIMLIDRMEEMVREMKDLDISPNLSTYNYLIKGYITAWMWDSMEKTFQTVIASHKPDTKTYLLMLRGYAVSRNLEQMEAIYDIVRDYVNENEITLIRMMVWAYCMSSAKDRVGKIETLMKLLAEKGYCAWLNVLLIRVYAKEGLIERMENSINEAFKHNVVVKTNGIMRAVVAGYYRCNADYAVDRLAEFVKRAESAGWRICRSLYHSQMAMYGLQGRLEEMRSVIDHMEDFYFPPSQKTFLILYKAYSQHGLISKVEQVTGLMYKHGYRIPWESPPP